MAQLMYHGAKSVPPSDVWVFEVAAIPVQRGMQEYLRADYGIECSDAEASFLTFWQPVETGRDGSMQGNGAEEEDIIEKLDELELLGARYGVTHILSYEIGIPGAKEALKLKHGGVVLC
jgi:hypothetical protein